MSSYCYEAVDASGLKTNGTLDVADQNEALRRIKEMGLFPTRVIQERARRRVAVRARPLAGVPRAPRLSLNVQLFRETLKPRALAIFTRQLATLVEAGMPLLRGLRTLREQAENPALEELIDKLGASIENGSSFSEALTEHPKVFNHLYINMVRAGELGGALELTLRRLTEFMEKAQKIKGKVKAALVYPCAVLFVAAIILCVMMLYIVPKFKEVFEGLIGPGKMPGFTLFILKLSEVFKNHFVVVGGGGALLVVALALSLRTKGGRRVFDQVKLSSPVFGPVFRKIAISRFSRTLGTLLGSGVPVLQALAIVRETTGNVIVGGVVATVQDSVKQGETLAVPLKASRVFPAMVAGMVDVGEQTGALPDMLMKIADNYDEEVDTAVGAMTSLLEPLMIVFLAVVVGSIVVAMFLPLKVLLESGMEDQKSGVD
jgi:type IV pilus assembly protein PilC